MRPRDTVLRMREWLLDRDVRHQSLAVLDESYIELERRNADRQRAREGLERALGHETRPPRWGPARQAHPVRRRAGMRRRGAAMGRQHHRRDLGQPARSRGRYPTTSPIGITCGPCSCSSPTSRTWALEHTRGRPLTLSSASFSVGSFRTSEHPTEPTCRVRPRYDSPAAARSLRGAAPGFRAAAARGRASRCQACCSRSSLSVTSDPAERSGPAAS
jgi:hypothetical protein